MKRRAASLAVLTGIVLAAGAVPGLGAAATPAAPLRIIASPVPHAEILRFVQTRLAPDLPLKIIEINNALRPNELLARGEVDANFWQHRPYLRQQEQDLGVQFAVLTAVHIEPLGLYSRRIHSLATLPDGATVSIPNNVTNLSRALYLLQDQKLLRLKPALTARDAQLATVRDVVDNPKHLKILPVDSAQIARSIDDVTIAVVNGNYALEAGLVPARDALALEPVQGNPYANVLVTTPALQNDPRVQRLAKLLAGPEVAAFIRGRYQGSVVPVNP